MDLPSWAKLLTYKTDPETLNWKAHTWSKQSLDPRSKQSFN